MTYDGYAIVADEGWGVVRVGGFLEGVRGRAGGYASVEASTGVTCLVAVYGRQSHQSQGREGDGGGW